MQNLKIRIQNISKKFQTAEGELNILESISQEFEQTKSYALIGVSGSGKSTLLYMLAGIEETTAGNIFFNDQNISLFSKQQKNRFLRNEIGLIFQEHFLIKELSVIENILIKDLFKSKIELAQQKEKAFILLKEIGLEQKANQLPGSLSVGQQQRVSILRAIFNKPKFLLADEPTGNLDAKTANSVFRFILDCKKKYNMGLIICTHDLSLASLCNTVLEIKDRQLKNVDFLNK